ncbi:hypothetical protein ANO11243_056850 [Dothideomycetidae sp. 11243]|nr:hypothetical protein ANO11243_056850 [fungal sp. No.11243]
MRFLSTLVAASALLVTRAVATCQFHNIIHNATLLAAENATELCMRQGAGHWTFAMETTIITVPGNSANHTKDHDSASVEFIIYDNDCVPQAAYRAPNCSTPIIAEENFLREVLILDKLNTKPHKAYFKFRYGDGIYSIRNNHCVCTDMTKLTGYKEATGCRCSFPVDGHFVG